MFHILESSARILRAMTRHESEKILIVDDNPVNRRILSMRLTSQGYEVLQAEDGDVAIGTARREKPDFILLDITFPPAVAHGGGVSWDGLLILS